MSFFLRCSLFLALSGVMFGMDQPLQDQLLDQLKQGRLVFSAVEAALISDGVSEPAQLQDKVQRYQTFLEGLKLDGAASAEKPKKQAKALHKKLFTALGGEGQPSDGLLALIENKAWTKVSATFVLADLAKQTNLQPSDWGNEKENLDPAFAGGAPELEVLAGLLTWQAFHHKDSHVSKLKLLLAAQLSSSKAYMVGDLDTQLYNRAFQEYQANNLVQAAELIIGGGTRYPASEVFPPLAYNTATKLLMPPVKDAHRALGLANDLLPLMGPHQAGFAQVVDSYQYNQAVQLYNQKEFEAALVGFEQVKNPPEPENFKKVLAATYANLAESRVLAGNSVGSEQALAKLGALDKDQADLLKLRLAQLNLKAMVESGELGKALAAAANHLEHEQDQKNYLAVLSQYNVSLREKADFEKALAILNSVPSELGSQPMVDELRFNTYSDWLESYPDEDTEHLIPLYQRVFADKLVVLSPENKEILRENYAICFYNKIKGLIENRHFEEASKNSKIALAEAPQNKALQEQAQLIKTILERVIDK